MICCQSIGAKRKKFKREYYNRIMICNFNVASRRPSHNVWIFCECVYITYSINLTNPIIIKLLEHVPNTSIVISSACPCFCRLATEHENHNTINWHDCWPKSSTVRDTWDAALYHAIKRHNVHGHPDIF